MKRGIIKKQNKNKDLEKIWDIIFHNETSQKKDHIKFLRFLQNLLKSQAYVELAYMTGILPIAKYSSGSPMNMFSEYTMANAEITRFSTCFGFTDEEGRKCRN